MLEWSQSQHKDKVQDQKHTMNLFLSFLILLHIFQIVSMVPKKEKASCKERVKHYNYYK